MSTETWIAGASLVVSIAAILLSWGIESRGQANARTQIFLELRTRFLDVLEDLPPQYRDAGWEAASPDERAAAMRYWHHVFDEWYVTKRLNQRLMRGLWDQYYTQAIRAGLGHHGLRKTLVYMLATDKALSQFWQDFRRDLEALWTAHHVNEAVACRGIECDHGPP